jgi:hypothetical protein
VRLEVGYGGLIMVAGKRVLGTGGAGFIGSLEVGFLSLG